VLRRALHREAFGGRHEDQLWEQGVLWVLGGVS